MITVVTPFSRKENLPFLLKAFQGKCNWIVLQSIDDPVIEFPEWVTVKRFEISAKTYVSNRLFNEFIRSGLEAETQYMILNDDDSVEEGFFESIPNEDIVYVSMKRGDYPVDYIFWDSFEERLGHIEHGIDILEAAPQNLKIGRVGGEQFIVKGKVLRNFRYGLSTIGDGEMVLKIAEDSSLSIVYAPQFYVLFNYFQDGRFKSFHRKPLVLFVGDYFCAGHPSMGISEWETNLSHSLDATGLADVATFHYDKFYLNFAKRGDEELIKWAKENKPDYIVIVVYKPLGSNPTVISLETIKELSEIAPLVSIWGDLEAEEQVALAQQVEPYCKKLYATATEEVVSKLSEKYIYMHVPKDPRIFNNPNKERDIDVLFNGSFGYGREERREVLQYLLDNGIKLVAGGSEGADHFSTEEYADRFKRAKIAIGFSRARGKDVINARCFEAMLCGSLYMVQESEEMKKLFTENKDYCSWTDKENLLSLLKLYLFNDELRNDVALSGQKKTEELYSAKTFWEKVLK